MKTTVNSGTLLYMSLTILESEMVMENLAVFRDLDMTGHRE